MIPAIEAVRFLLELAMLAALAVAGAAVSPVLAVVLPVLAAAVWARWIAPKSRRRLADPVRLAVELALFAAAGIGLAAVGHPPLGGALLAAATVVAVALRAVGSSA